MPLDCPRIGEHATDGATIESLQKQTRAPEEIIVVDDFSDDATGAIAASYGVTVHRPPANTGTKAGAQNFALSHVNTTHCMVVDADTTLAPDAIEKILPAFDDGSIAAACGFVVPRRVKTVWERGRYIEYLFSFSFYKQVQDFYRRPLISSGCFSTYDTARLRELGGWQTRTMAEDMDLTWTIYEAGFGVRFMPEACSYPVEPENLRFLRKQLTRWSHAFVQNVRLHWRGIRSMRYLFSSVMVGYSDAVLASLVYLAVLPVLMVIASPWFILGYIIDAPVISTFAVMRRRGPRLAGLPGFLRLWLVGGLAGEIGRR
ncbi:MAG: glycosyltransferase family 2 protein [Pseudonocardiaceae bacterium]